MNSALRTALLCTALLFCSTVSNALTDVLKVKITGNNYSDETIMRFLPDATTEFDGNYDAYKFFSPNPNVPSLYTQIDTASQLSINAYPSLDSAFTFSLFTRIPVTGNYSFRSIEMGSFATGVTIVMEDLLTGNTYDLRDTATLHTILLSVTTQSNPARFAVHFTPPLFTTVSLMESELPDLQVFGRGHEIVIEPMHVSAAGKTLITVFDLQGREQFFLERTLQQSEQFTYAPPSCGVYVVNMLSGSTLISKKVLIAD
jgi:hypothetical protein